MVSLRDLTVGEKIGKMTVHDKPPGRRYNWCSVVLYIETFNLNI